MKFYWLFFAIALVAVPVTYAEESAGKRELGKQIVQTIDLPASTSTWERTPDDRKNIGTPRPVDKSKTDTVHYWLFLPNNYEEQAKLGGAPLILFLHGAGERGTRPEEIDKVKVHGIPHMLDIPEFSKDFPCVAVSPQCKHHFAWSPAQLLLLLDHVEKNYKIDKRRIYVTGLSMGGFGTWMCLNENPNRFAAAVPICGGAETGWARKMTNIPVWIFHGDKDPAVAVKHSYDIVEAIRNKGA